jgi:hypothetical protein
MSILRFPVWQSRCEEAFSEREPRKVFDRVVAAETAIFRRLQELKSAPERVELEAIDAALKKLRRLITNPHTRSDAGKVVPMPALTAHGRSTLDGAKRQHRPGSLGADRSG